jgi:hypothetical protein
MVYKKLLDVGKKVVKKYLIRKKLEKILKKQTLN